MGAKNSKWIKKWPVTSSDGSQEYTVSQDKDGNFGCSCPRWIFTHKETGDCKHIMEIRDKLQFGGLEGKQPPTIVLAKVREVTLKKETNEALTPLYSAGDTHMAATIVYDLLKLGCKWEDIRFYNGLAKENSRQAIVDYVEVHGRKVYSRAYWAQRKGWIGEAEFEIVPVVRGQLKAAA
jgi:hypothetical protein